MFACQNDMQVFYTFSIILKCDFKQKNVHNSVQDV